MIFTMCAWLGLKRVNSIINSLGCGLPSPLPSVFCSHPSFLPFLVSLFAPCENVTSKILKNFYAPCHVYPYGSLFNEQNFLFALSMDILRKTAELFKYFDKEHFFYDIRYLNKF